MYVQAPVFTGGVGSQGLGSISLDPSTWTLQDYLLVAALGWVAFSIFLPSGAPLTGPRRKRKPISGKTGFISGLGTMAALGIGGYFAYQYFVNSSSASQPSTFGMLAGNQAGSLLSA